jgi:hypothetical protein
MRVQTAYSPEFEDRLFHVMLPFTAYMALMLAAITVRSNPDDALFTVAGAALLLLFVGIHNAWDGITYHVYAVKGRQGRKREEHQEPTPSNLK